MQKKNRIIKVNGKEITIRPRLSKKKLATIEIIPESDFRPNWENYSLCKDKPIELLETVNKDQVREETEKMCDACPVQSECLTVGMKVDEIKIIYGGLSNGERERWREIHNYKS